MSDYPVQFDIDCPEGERDRFTALLRLFTVLPIALILALVSRPAFQLSAERYAIVSGGIIFAPTVLMLLVRRKYPRWWFDWNVELTRFATRVSAYVALLRDEYPATDAEQGVHLDLRYPDAQRDLDRWLPLVKWLLVVPHYLCLAVLGIAAVGAVFIAWCSVLVIGRYPRGLFDFVVGVHRWWLRVLAYAYLLATDAYPPFRLSP